jgi:hypothetical protein
VDEAQLLNILFPSGTANNGSAQVKADQPVDIPEVTWLRMDVQPGTEKVWLVWADQPLAELEAAGKYASPPHNGEIKDRKLSADVEAFLKTHAASTGSVERSEDRTKAVARAQDRILVHLVRLEHH